VARSPAFHRSGRPKDIAKRAAIIEAARDLFASQAFDLVTMDAVAIRAGVSKMTVYSHFNDKETLFETIVATTAQQMISALAAPEQGGGLRERFIAVGTTFLSVILGSDICTMVHTLPGALRGNQTLANRFYAAGPGRVRAAIGSMIAASAERGELIVDDAMRAADDLVSLWEGGLAAKIAFGLSERITADEIALRARRGTDVFLRAYRPQGGAPLVSGRPA
jgi:TetR/AcrR family transcriptional repressor of mexJK operon